MLDDAQNWGLNAAIEPHTRTSRAKSPVIALTGGLSLPHYFIEGGYIAHWQREKTHILNLTAVSTVVSKLFSYYGHCDL